MVDLYRDLPFLCNKPSTIRDRSCSGRPVFRASSRLDGLMCFLAVGMAEVSSTQALVEVGKHYKKGDPLGCFHYGGSTHCLIFRPETELEFFNDVSMGTETSLRPGTWYNTPVNIDATNVPVRAQIAKAFAKDL